MTERKCANCGELKDVYQGKICQKNDHFLCKDCAFYRSECPLDGSPLK